MLIMTLEAYRLAMIWLLSIGTLLAAAFVIVYSWFFYWWRSEIGRHLVFTRVSIGVALGLTLMGILGIFFPLELGVAVIGAIDVALLWSVLLALRSGWRSRHANKTDIEERQPILYPDDDPRHGSA